MSAVAGGVRTNTLALIAFISAFLVPLLGLILGIVARNQLDAPGSQESGRGFARRAMVIGAPGTVVQLVFLAYWVWLFAQMFTRLPVAS